MPTMYRRLLALPASSFFLFGPRATGKTTWLRQVLPDAHWIDLVPSEAFVRYLREPALFRREVEALPPGWIVVDEVQKVPALLDEVHALIARHGARYRFALSGSSARKLRRFDANLLAGRVANRSFFPLTFAETDFRTDIDDALRIGMLPGVVSAPASAEDTLEAYAANYVHQEIQQEALTKDLPGFARFLRVAAILNGQSVSAANVANEAGVARATVQRHFQILVDTLIGVTVPAWQPRLKVREVAHPRFYFFDPGVARAVAGRIRAPVHEQERGSLLETWVLHELRAHMQFALTGGEVSWYRTGAGAEVDFIWRGPHHAVGIEVKASERWRPDAGAALRELLERKAIRRAVAVYLGDRPLKDGAIDVLPARAFAQQLGDLLA
ncbi:MAG: ATP-binding protein [Phycisphaerales bacterium]|nr:ATP-binding protein [Phycisphaerales bacterium]